MQALEPPPAAELNSDDRGKCPVFQPGREGFVIPVLKVREIMEFRTFRPCRTAGAMRAHRNLEIAK